MFAAAPPPADAMIPSLASAMWAPTERVADLLRAIYTAREAPLGQTPKEVVWRKNKSSLLRYHRTTPAAMRTPIFITMPLINRPDILDLYPGNSFVEFLLGQGFDVFMYEWGNWGPEDRRVDIDQIMTAYLPRAVRHAAEIAGHDVCLLGYCIGGTLATLHGALYPDAPVKSLVLFTAPIDFAEAGEFGLWTAKDVFPIEQIREALPTMPGELIDVGSKMLNPLSNTVGTYVRLMDKLGDPDFDVKGWQAMYRWVNESTPFPGAAYYQWITEFYQNNKLAKGTLKLAGRRVKLADISLPILNVAASNDVIAPRPTTSAILRLVSSRDKEELLIEGGHVGMVVGRAAKKNLWPRVADWMSRHDER